MKQLEQSWRWFGPNDPVSLADIRQAGATSIVTALHHIPIGEVWPVAEIESHKNTIAAAGLRWSVVESVPVHDDIKRQDGNWRTYIKNYQQTLRNLGQCGIPTVTWNFMPVLDWTRTDLQYSLPDGARALRFDATALAAFDLFMLKRPGAATDFSDKEQQAAYAYFKTLSSVERDQLQATIIAGLPGAEEGYDLQSMREAISRYEGLAPKQFRRHLADFIKQIAPVAEAAGVRLAIHPDDPPFSLLGLPRVVSTAEDLRALLAACDEPANGLCFCTGSLGARPDNDLPAMLQEFSSRVNFLHLRNVQREENGSFHEADHLHGSTDMYAIVQLAFAEQQQRSAPIPMRPDHGHQMLDDLHKQTNPGYSAIGRLRGLAELRGLEWAILQQHISTSKTATS